MMGEDVVFGRNTYEHYEDVYSDFMRLFVLFLKAELCFADFPFSAIQSRFLQRKCY